MADYTDGYIFSTVDNIASPGIKIRVRDVTLPKTTEQLYTSPSDTEPTSGPSIVAIRIDQPNRRTIKIVCNTNVTLAASTITVTGKTVTGIRVAGHIVYCTLDSAATEIDKNGARTPDSVTVAANTFTCLTPDGVKGNSATTQTIAYRIEYTLREITDWPYWAVAAYQFNTLHPTLNSDPDLDVLVNLPPSINTSTSWYIHNPSSTQVLDGTDFTGNVSIGADSIPINCTLTSGPLKSFGYGKITEKTSDNKYKITATDTCAASGGGTQTIIGVVLGGNSGTVRITPTSTGSAIAASTSSILAYPVPFTNSAGALTPLQVPVPIDWAQYVLPSTWVTGNALPVLPDGLCYVKLERPYSAYGAAWDAALPPNTSVISVGPPTAAGAYILGTSTTTIAIYFNRNIQLVDPVTSNPSVQDISTNTTIEVSSTNISNNVLSLNVTALDNSHNYRVTIPGGLLQTVETGDAPPSLNVGIVLPVTFKNAAGAVLVCANRKSYQMFQAGDLVNLALEGATILDSKGVLKQVAEIIGPATNQKQPHYHAYGRFDTGATSGTALS